MVTKKYRENIHNERGVKQIAKEQDTNIGGILEVPLRKILLEVETLLDQLGKDYLPWIEQQKEWFGYYLSRIPPKDLERDYKEGLSSFIRQKYKTIREMNPSELHYFSDETYLRETIEAYTHDFIMLLRQSFCAHIQATTGLRIAKRTHKYDPGTIHSLTSQFPEFNTGLITHVMINNPNNPAMFLNQVKDTINTLAVEFPEFDKKIITHAAVDYPKNPAGFLNKVKEEVDRLYLQFSDFERWTVTYMVVNNPRNPKGALEKLQKTVTQLSLQFPEFEKWVIIRVATYYKSSIVYLKKLKKKYHLLQKKFPYIESKTIIKALVRSSLNDPETYLRTLKCYVDGAIENM